ncbi:Vacuolar H+/Ca2+ exchanger [Coniochaeta hoffmannii]|uniref:Vacuolar H+/Ca2+ exchanger n=1 Tax=Coniochaeta hoffmannii TaxID=91930 RepID=A0AA38VBZ9_9PEZI|nr:Vacuolar H+/Ca2+ exchanger [Coniochaeta hoffmannii]
MDGETLSSIIRGYDASFDSARVRAVLDRDESGALAAWVAAHLTPDTLLTAEELLQYSTLEKSGRADQLGASLDAANGQSFRDEDIKSAIEELNRSTATINKQTETLRHQQDALARLIKNESKDAQARAVLDLEYSQALDIDRKALRSAVDGLCHDIELQLSELDSHGSGSLDKTRQVVGSLFVADDKLLSSLQKLGWELETEDPQEKEDVKKLQDICARLIKYSVEACRTRLDRIFLDSLEAASSANGRHAAQGEDLATVQDELESLYSEILPVAQMSVDQQYLAPALKSLTSRNGKSFAKTAHAIDYIRDCLDYLLGKTEAFCSRMERFHAHQMAASQVAAICRTELAAPVEQASAKKRRPTMGASPTRRRKSSDHGSSRSPVRLRTGQALRNRRRSSTTGILADETPLEQLLRMLALSLPEAGDIAQSSISNPQVAALATALADRTAKVADVAANVQESFEASATTQIKDSSLAHQLLRDSLLAESPFGKVELVDPEIEGSIRVLDQELANVGKKLERVHSEVTLIRGRRGKQDELIRRWGS